MVFNNLELDRGERAGRPVRLQRQRPHGLRRRRLARQSPHRRLASLVSSRFSSTALIDRYVLRRLEAAIWEGEACPGDVCCQWEVMRRMERGQDAMPARSLSFSRRSTPSETSPTPTRVRHGYSGSGDFPVCAVPHSHTSTCTLPGLRVDTGIEPDHAGRSAGWCDGKKGPEGCSASARFGYAFFTSDAA